MRVYPCTRAGSVLRARKSACALLATRRRPEPLINACTGRVTRVALPPKHGAIAHTAERVDVHRTPGGWAGAFALNATTITWYQDGTSRRTGPGSRACARDARRGGVRDSGGHSGTPLHGDQPWGHAQSGPNLCTFRGPFYGRLVLLKKPRGDAPLLLVCDQEASLTGALFCLFQRKRAMMSNGDRNKTCRDGVCSVQSAIVEP
jgi:hypothetical protein